VRRISLFTFCLERSRDGEISADPYEAIRPKGEQSTDPSWGNLDITSKRYVNHHYNLSPSLITLLLSLAYGYQQTPPLSLPRAYFSKSIKVQSQQGSPGQLIRDSFPCKFRPSLSFPLHSPVLVFSTFCLAKSGSNHSGTAGFPATRDPDGRSNCG